MRRPPPHRTSTHRDPVVLLGTALVLALVAMLPLALALMTADGSGDDAGVGSGAGEVTAAALSSLHRDLNSKRASSDALPDPTERVVPPFLAACPPPSAGRNAPGLCSHGPSLEPTSFEPPPVGPGPHGNPLLL